MAIILMLGWWYGAGWLWMLRGISKQLETISETFSVSTLLRTWFSPWKQIHSTASIHNFFSVALDNTVSRLVGATVRTFMLFTALLFSTFTIVFGLLLAILWPLLPPLVIILPIASFTGWGI